MCFKAWVACFTQATEKIVQFLILGIVLDFIFKKCFFSLILKVSVLGLIKRKNFFIDHTGVSTRFYF